MVQGVKEKASVNAGRLCQKQVGIPEGRLTSGREQLEYFFFFFFLSL